MKTVNMVGGRAYALNAQEQAQICGGNALNVIKKIIEAAGLQEYVDAFIKGFNEGFKDGYAEQQNKQ